jgi:hypothetical protein
MDVQTGFDFSDHEENLERVSSRISRAVLNFCRDHKRFHADELRRAVIAETGITAPASADRILRYLRQRGLLSYTVLSRRESLYEVTAINGESGR